MTKNLVTYLFLSYFLSWIFFILLALNHHEIIFLYTDDAAHARTQDLWHAFGGLGPILAAVITLKYILGKNQFRQFLDFYSPRKISVSGWWLAFSPFIIFGFAIAIHRILNNDWFNPKYFFVQNDLFTPLNFLAWFFPLITYGFGEEAGWRGFALPILQKKYSAFISTCILSVFWIGWHIPSFWYRYHLSGGMLIGFILGVFAGAIWLTFIFNYTKGSLLAVSIWHFSWNLVSMIGKDGVMAAIMSTIIMMLAVFVLIKYGGRELSPFVRVTFNGRDLAAKSII